MQRAAIQRAVLLCAVNAQSKLLNLFSTKHTWDAADRSPAAAEADNVDFPTHGLVDVPADLVFVADFLHLGLGYVFGNEFAFCTA